MELNVNIDYQEILELVYQLPKKDIEKLMAMLQTGFFEKKSKESISELILKAPTWSDSEFQDYNQARNHINKSRII